MMGNKKLSEIRAELVEHFKEAGIALEWFDKEIRRCQKKKNSAVAVETLNSLRDLIKHLEKAQKRRRRKKVDSVRTAKRS